MSNRKRYCQACKRPMRGNGICAECRSLVSEGDRGRSEASRYIHDNARQARIERYRRRAAKQRPLFGAARLDEADEGGV